MVGIIRAWVNYIVGIKGATLARAAIYIARIFVPSTKVNIVAGPEKIGPISGAPGEIYLPTKMLNVTVFLAGPRPAFTVCTSILLHCQKGSANLRILRFS